MPNPVAGCATSEILNFWNFAVRHVYMPTDLSLFLSLPPPSLFLSLLSLYLVDTSTSNAHDRVLKKLVQLQSRCGKISSLLKQLLHVREEFSWNY